MRYTLSNNIIETANKVSKIPFAKSLLKPIYYPYKKFLQRRRNEHFRRHALEALMRFDQCLSENGFEYTLAFGTMLGAIREKGFIKHDLDIDVAMWNDQYSPQLRHCLETSGFSLIHSFEVDNGKLGREETYCWNDINIDIFYFYPPLRELPYCCDFIGQPGCPTYRMCMKKYGGALPRRIELPMTKERVKVQFEDIELFVPSNAKEILSFRYGPDYMTPRKDWTIGSYDTHITPWNEKLGIFKEF